MHLRGIGFTFKNVVTRPLVLAEGFITPLMVRASTIADELSASSITRGIDNPDMRTAFFRLHISAADTVATVAALFLIAGIMAAKYWISGGGA